MSTDSIEMVKYCFQFAESGRCSFGTSCKFSHGESNSSKRSKKKQKRSAPIQSNVHIEEFFAQYPTFDYDPTEPSSQEFYRMCDTYGWEKDDEERVQAHEGFKTALVEQFNTSYGTEVDDIDSWQGLCRALDIFPLPKSVKEAKRLYLGVYVNLVDLIDAGRSGDPVTQFSTLQGLKTYTIEKGRYFPREHAYAGGLLKYLLREILTEYKGTRRR